MNNEIIKDLLIESVGYSVRYLAELNGRSVYPSAEALARLSAIDEPLPETGMDASQIINFLNRVGAPATVASAGPRYFGFVTGGTLPVALAANWMAGAWDQNAFSTTSSPISVALENLVITWLIEMFGLPEGSGGALVTGATMANFTGLAAARHAVLDRVGWDVEANGLHGGPPVTVLAGEEAHASLFKALGYLGLGRSNVVRLDVDGQGRIRPGALPKIVGPTILCLQAGNVNTGAFDQATHLIPPARAAGAWVHVDGAFGLWAATVPERANLTVGYAEADSWAVDAHKWLNVPYDSGITLVRDPKTLVGAMSVNAAYLMTEDSNSSIRNPIDYCPESSRRLRAVEIWAALKFLGRRGLAELVERNCRFATRIAEGLISAGFEVLNQVVLNQVLVSFGENGLTERVIVAIQEDGTCWCGGTKWRGRTAMRVSVSSWATKESDVERVIDALVCCARAQGA